jgi:FAD/FMN-containing dehydrogenase/Fe-S oxidoreductase
MARSPELPVPRRTGRGVHAPPPTPPRPDAVSGTTLGIDVNRLAAVLRSRIRGEVRFDDGDRALYSTDASNYRQIPIGVVVPRDADDVVATVGACRGFGAPIVSRGGATDLAGAACNAAVVIDMSKYMNHVLEIDWENEWARVEPGTVLDDLRNQAEARHLTFGPDPATHARNTLGGMIGNNSCGMHAQMAGKVEDNTLELEVLTYDGLRTWVGPTSDAELEQIITEGGVRGEIYSRLARIRDTYGDRIRERFPRIPRLVSGYPLHQLLPEHGFNVARALVGTEGTCVVVLQAKLHLVHSPPVRTLVIVGYDDLFTAGDDVRFCNGFDPIALEGIDGRMLEFMRDKNMSTAGRSLFPDGNAWLIVEFGGESLEESAGGARRLTDALDARGTAARWKMFEDVKQEHLIWAIREACLGSVSKVPRKPDFYPGWEDSAVSPDDMGNYLRDLTKLIERHGYIAGLYGHFGQGCLHSRIDFDLFTAEGIANWKAFLNDAAHLVTSYGGSLSGEHGDGQSRGSLLPIMFGDEIMQAFRDFKAAWDPRGKMNPGKVVDAYPVDVNLRWGTHYHPWEPETHFSFGNDRSSFAYAANRCVGTGVCRKHDSGTMCPSYMATREEKHSTRGRSRLLFEMLEGNPLSDGWRDEAVKDALDLCLACKACRSECPVSVDMATYKAEFLSHYHEGRRRSLSAYAYGLMHRWARLASYAPWAANFVTQTPALRSVAKRVIGMAPERRIPPFTRHTFRHWYSHRARRNTGGTPVILWPDTWNNYFLPETAQAAVEVLEAAGFDVLLPSRPLCCGRPLYDYGMLEVAERLLRRILATLAPHLRAGTSIVGLEPSCVSVFRDELVNMVPGDEGAKRLRDQTFTLSEFLVKKAPTFTVPRLARKVVVHGHCHEKSMLDFGCQTRLVEATGAEYTILDSGCCGMAGAFGYDRGERYDVSIACGERVLLPAVRGAPADTLIVADGFSCREQIAQTTARRAIHSAELLKLAVDDERAAR